MQPHPGHHECLNPTAARLTAERFVDLVNGHPEIQDLLELTPDEPPPVPQAVVEEVARQMGVDPSEVGIIWIQESEE